MADLTPTDIMAPPTSDQIKQRLIEGLQAIPGFPVDDYASGGVTRTIVELERVADESLFQQALPAMLGSAAVELASPPWLSMDAIQLYSRPRLPAVIAVQNLTLTCDGSHGPYTITAGQLLFQGATGHRWSNITGGTLPTSGSLTIQIMAEGPGALFNDPAGTIKTLLIPVAGVTAVNVASDFGAITVGAQSPGTIAASRTAALVAPTPATFIIRIDASGQVSAGAWSYSVDGGRTFVSAGIITATDLLLATGSLSGTRVTFTNHGSATPSFVVGDLFYFSTPGTSFVTVGKDEEADAALIARCEARWPDLEAVPTQSRYAKWAKAASTEVTRVRLEEDAVYLGRLYVTLAGVAGAVSGGAVSAVQSYIDPRAPIGRIIVARNSSARQITGAGTVQVAAAKLVAVQLLAQTLWQAVLFAADIGQVVRVADLVRAVMDAGAIDFTGPLLNGGGNVALASTEVPILNTATPLLANQLTWQAL